MSKFVLVGDPHFSSNSFGSRLDDTIKTQLQKLDFVLSYAQEQKASVIFAGDFLHNNNNSTSFLLSLIRVFQKYCSVVCYTIGGNHECRGTDFSSYENSQVQLLFQAGVLRFLDYGIETERGLIRGYSAYSKLNLQDSEKVFCLVTHHFIDSSYNDPLIYTTRQAKQDFPALEVMFCGHDHSYHDIDLTPVQVIRPGSLFRVTSAKENNRKPKVVLMSVTSERVSFSYKEVPCSSYRAVFSVEAKTVGVAQKQLLERFVADLKTQTTNFIDLSSLLEMKLVGVEDSGIRDLIRSDLKLWM